MSKKNENDPIAEAQKRQAEIVAEQEKQQSAPPTPTQEEADRAKLGILDGDFAPSGEPEVKAEAAEKPSASYTTRAAKAD